MIFIQENNLFRPNGLSTFPLGFLDSIFYLPHICGTWGNLVALVQFKKREKHPWRSVNFSKVSKISTSPRVFFTFFVLMLQIAQRTTYIYIYTLLSIRRPSRKTIIPTYHGNSRKRFHLSLFPLIILVTSF